MTALPASPDAPKSGYLPTLDGWRAVAILGVMIAHATEPIFAAEGAFPSTSLYQVTRFGARGVDLFFAISGFLITSRLLEEFRANGRISLRDFYVRRLFRIVPPFMVYVLAVAIGAALGAWTVSGIDLLTSLTFTRNYLTPADSGSWYTGHLWSLCVEEHFYFLWPGLLVLLGPRRCLPWVLAFSLVLMGWSVVEFRLQLVSRLLPEVGYYIRTDICLSKLLIAAAAAIALEYHPETTRRILRPRVMWLVLLTIIGVWATTPPLALQLESVLFAMLVTCTVLHPETIIGRGLELNPMRWVGRISYSLYLWQQMFLVGLGVGPVFVQRLPWSVLATFACAIASYRYVERPMIRLGRRFAPPVSPGRPAGESGAAT